ncbi:MAG TPA: hypothetical protein EYP10_04500 [Armatimonadetes bacterium]|nr:hypothetical protein [Armatimonadota bacterium]
MVLALTRRVIAFAMCAMICAFFTRAHSTTSEWHQSEFVCGVYMPWERIGWVAKNAGMDKWTYCAKLMGELAERYNVNLVWVVNIATEDAVRICRLGAKHGIKVMPTASTMLHWFYWLGPRQFDEYVQRTAEAFAKVEGFYAYVLVDEPRTHDMMRIEAMRAALERIDPRHPSFAVTMVRDTESAAKRTRFHVLVTDVYPFFAPLSPNGPNTPQASRAYYRFCIMQLAKLAQRAGKLHWVMPQIFADVWGPWHYDKQMNVVLERGAYHHWRMPTLGEVRWQIWNAIASGAKGIVFFVLFPAPNERKPTEPYRGRPLPSNLPLAERAVSTGMGCALLYNNGTPTPQMKVMAQQFAICRRLSDLLMNLEPSVMPVGFAREPLYVATLTHRGTGETFIVVINDDTDNAVEATISLMPHVESVRDVISGQRFRAGQSNGEFGQVRLRVDAGSGRLLQIAAREGAGAMCIIYDDFETQVIAAKLQNAERRLLRAPWGIGWIGEIIPKGNSATVEYDLSRKPIAQRGKLFIWLDIRTAESLNEAVALRTSTDGKNFKQVTVNEPPLPTPLPEGTKWIRITLSGNTALRSVTINVVQ